MEYTAKGFTLGKPVSNDLTIFSGFAGCWGVLAHGGSSTTGKVINQISFKTEVERVSDTAYRVLKPAEVSNLDFIVQCVDAINEGYLEYEVKEVDHRIHISFNNLHDKLKQRTMWILFTLRSLFQYQGTAELARHMKGMKTNFTLRELIIYGQTFYKISDMASQIPYITKYNSGGTALRHSDLSLADFRAILRGGRYYTGSALSKVLWSEGGGYKSGTNVQNTARATDTRSETAVGTQQSEFYLVIKSFQKNERMCSEGFRKLVRLVKYYKKD